MTMLFLIRHGAHAVVEEILVGRTPGIHLNEEGYDQAQRIAGCLSCERITAVQSSPQTRSYETAWPIAERFGLPVEIVPAIDELDTGAWTGRTFSMLSRDPSWLLWNSARGSARPPRGESMEELQRRATAHIENLAATAPQGRIAMVSHAEVIRAVVLHALEIPFDQFRRVEIAPGSISTISIENGHAAVIALNQPPSPRRLQRIAS